MNTLTNIVGSVARSTQALTFDLFSETEISEFESRAIGEFSVEQVLRLPGRGQDKTGYNVHVQTLYCKHRLSPNCYCKHSVLCIG